MASIGYGAKLPLSIDPESGPYTLHQSLRKIISQNLKMLMLTSPGERIMNTHYGVGLRRFIFEPNKPHIKDAIETKIRTQIRTYMSFIQIIDINFANIENTLNAIKLRIRYSSHASGQQEVLEIDLKTNAVQ